MNISSFIIMCFASLSFLSAAALADEPAKVWSHESEAAIVQTSGNSDTESFNLKHSSTKKKDKNLYNAKGSHLRTSAENSSTGREEETARKWDVGLRYERSLDEKWSGYTGYKVESDKFAGYQQRHNTDIGAKYIVFKGEKTTVLTEGGYRYTHENRLDGSQVHSNGARAFAEVEHKLAETTTAKGSLEYVPNFDDSKDYQMSMGASLSSALSSLFSLKVSHETKIDNKPAPGAKKNDSTFTTALVAKF